MVSSPVQSANKTVPLYLTASSVTRRADAPVPVKRAAESAPPTGDDDMPLTSKRLATGNTSTRHKKSVLEPMREEDAVVDTESPAADQQPATDPTSNKSTRKVYARSLTTSSNVQQAGKSVTGTKGAAAK